MANSQHRVEAQQQEEQAPKLCIKHCGFYGNPSCLDMCSKCYREHMVDQQPAPESSPAVVALATPAAAAAAAAVAPPVTVVPQEAEVVPELEPEKPSVMPAAAEQPPQVEEATKEVTPEKPTQANRSRCLCCNKKVGLLGFECRCGFVYCSAHRHANEHSCTFDYKTMDRERLAKANPTVAASRVDKI